MKKKLKIPSTQLIQTSELTELEKEKELLTTELIDCKARLLNLEEKEKESEKDVGLWAKKENDFETKQEELEKGLKKKNEKKVQVISPSVQFSVDSLSQDMSQVSLIDLE